MKYKTTYQSPVGCITLASDGTTLNGLWIENQKYHGETIHKDMIHLDSLPIFATIKEWLDSYFNGEKPTIDGLPLNPIGGEFRQQVWQILCKIPYGQVVTYGEIAKEIALKTNKAIVSAQAVGGAVGHNPISIIIPCHRVVGANNNLTGYASGIPTKIRLLKLDGADMARFVVTQ